MLSAAKKTQFTALFRQFAQDYLSQPQGQAHLKQYQLNRAQGQKNFEEIQKETLDGHLPTDKVLQKLLPHTDTDAHKKSGVWIKNAGTSVDQIERFYARNLPLSKEMAINLQSFGSD